MKESTAPPIVRPLSGFLGKGVEKVIIIAFAVLLLLFGGMVYFSDRTSDRLMGAMIWVDDTHDIVDVMKDFELDLREAESALRGYVITGNVAKRDEYLRKSSTGLQARLKKIHSMTDGHQSLKAPLERIEFLTPQRLELMRESHQLFEGNMIGQDEVHRKGSVLMDQLEVAFQKFIVEARKLTSGLILEREAEAKRLKTVLLNSALLGGFFAIFALTMILRGLYTRRQTEAFMRSALYEKDILIKEIHHRVKNNLQIISSLLILQGNKIKDPEAANIFLECRERIQFMASLHRQLYASGNFTRINFGKNLNEIGAMLIRSHSPPDCKVEFKSNIAPLELDIETSQVMGLIVSEVLLNALKHAFKGRSTGTISVELTSSEVTNKLVICDDGVGIIPEAGVIEKTHAGVALVEALTNQLRGKFEISNVPTGGLCFSIEFPSLDLKKEITPRHY
jgi:two-component sensor histidine kinase